MISHGYTVQEWVDESSRSPYRQWVDGLEKIFRVKIAQRVRLFEEGHFGDSKALGKGLYECRWNMGPGFRAYYGIEGARIILLLGGGDKSTQKRDIQKARQRWRRYQENRGRAAHVLGVRGF